ncbi:hypothetical protein GE21DRAFT_9778 [Neurospora crassa]|uniref:CRAL/TRIO domain-containing protein n=2 Tax=Neurospora crassa (strain ATCC 24698 / 74-OR23-1A / CBS 708.71 / DSM 1257 / FGSC 987) TaxID=367110 RepID=V5IM77_NEUCR|nr:CRAL/TRIO domain-containing protein [Neurospora crassa OR74A]ESA41826.1 CRAL/TRIO domain-containing protein [Neurospora crassa OR74A]KHE82549.1 hypothetical protein GE21DRAFT_9778 [Neurospora crassa]|eukprot:XP_011395253.1 CRAL/TRIO domain-containing protein [Neurospora crassa OR74A]
MRLPPPSTPTQLLRLRLTRSALSRSAVSTTSPLATSTCPSSQRTVSTKVGAATITPGLRFQSLLFPPSTAITTTTTTTTTAFFSRNNLSTSTTTVNKRDQTVKPTVTLAPSTPVVLRASVTGLGLLFVLGLGLGYGITGFLGQKSTEQQELPSEASYTTIQNNIQDILDDESSTTNMSREIAPGRPGNLTPEQEEKLKQLWKLIFQVCGVSSPSPSSESSTPAATSDDVSIKGDDKKKKSKLSMFSRKHKKDSDDTTPDSASTASGSMPGSPAIVLNASTTSGDDDKYNQLSKFHETLASQSPAAIRETIWSMVKHDHPDALVLRFLRARKWDVEKALVMFISTMNWRDNEMKVDADIMRSGEGGAAEAEKMEAKTSEEIAKKKLAIDFLTQTRMGKSYVHGVDKQGRPICFVRVRLHKQGEQSEESLERYTVYLIETCRMLLQGSVDTATIVFDMTGFSMANMDYAPVKFMVKCFEANYPECLGAVLVHKAPWIFQGIWRVIRGWLDPVVANKVHFTNNISEMSEFISPEKLPKDLDGQEDWEYKYVEPVPGENDRMKDEETISKLQAARAELVKEYEEATLQWIQASGNSEELKKKRDAIAEKLRVDYWNLDPYVRARSFYDRIGVLLPGGKLDPFLEGKKDGVSGITEGVAKVGVSDTQADDVD